MYERWSGSGTWREPRRAPTRSRSVHARGRARTCRRCRRRAAARARRGRAGATARSSTRTAVKSVSSRAAHSSISSVSARVSVHTEYTSRPPGRTIAAACASSVRLQRRRAGRPVAGCTRQRASGRRRNTPRPLHGASSSTRSNVAAANGSASPDATSAWIDARCRRPGGLAHEPQPARVQVGGDHEAVVAHAFGDAGGLAPGRRRDVEHTLALLRVERAHHRLAGLVLRRDPPFAHAAQAFEIAGADDHDRVVDQRAVDVVRAAHLELAQHRGAIGAQRVDAQRDRARFVHRLERARASSAAEARR